MRSLKSIVIAALLLVTTTSSVVAQSKVAHINVQQLLSDMPDMKSAQAELKKVRGDLQGRYRSFRC